MPRPALILAALVALAAAAGPAPGLDPHLDRGLVPGGCAACHRGHGVERSPMLPGPQREVCLACHESRARADAEVGKGNLAPSARPPFLGTALAAPSTHPVSASASSRLADGEVTCTSCHSPHRGSVSAPASAGRRLSTRDPRLLEYELCERCHGGAGVTTRSLADVSRAFDASSRSSHPVHVPAAQASPSLAPERSGREIDCTDCHGHDDAHGARGPHGSAFAPILVAAYALTDGAAESPSAYALCYRCHARDRVLDSPLFPQHRRHVVAGRASCASCHAAHGSVRNRALIRFGEETTVAGVARSASTGTLAFASDVPGSGRCWLTCHGVDHAGRPYGTLPPP